MELEAQNDSEKELRNMLRALASSLHSLCEDGKLPMHSVNKLQNNQFAEGNPDGTLAVWRGYGVGYHHDPVGGRISYGSTDS